jgi:uncharacterized membrane protein
LCRRLAITDLFEDAFRPIADGAANIEVMIRLQKAFKSILKLPNYKVAVQHSKKKHNRAENAINHNEDICELKKNCIVDINHHKKKLTSNKCTNPLLLIEMISCVFFK